MGATAKRQTSQFTSEPNSRYSRESAGLHGKEESCVGVQGQEIGVVPSDNLIFLVRKADDGKQQGWYRRGLGKG